MSVPQVEDRKQNVKEISEIESDVSTCVVSDFSTDSEKSGGRRLSLFSHGAVLPTAVCLSKAAIGAGVLTMAGHAAEVGIVFQAFALIGAAVLSLASIRFIATACIATGCYSYEDLCDELLHPVMAFHLVQKHSGLHWFCQFCHWLLRPTLWRGHWCIRASL